MRPVFAGVWVFAFIQTFGYPSSDPAAVRVEVDGDSVDVSIDGNPFTRYHHDLADRPFFFPVLLDGQWPLTRGWPVDPGPDDQEDHRHHRGLWFTHGSVNGFDFWSEAKGTRIVQESIDLDPAGDGFTTNNRWEDPDGNMVCRDSRSHRFATVTGGVILDFTITIEAGASELILGDTKEGSMAIRLAPTLRVKGSAAQGHMVSSEGLRDGEVWGKRAAWVDAWGPVEDHVVGVAIFDHPANPRHPTWWHARTYGLFAANPFGIHDFEQKPEGTGDLRIGPGETVTFRYRILFHHGDTESADVASLWHAYETSYHDEP